MQLLPNRFQTVEFSPEEEKAARHVSALTLAYLMNKTAAYAEQALNFSYTDVKDLQSAVTEHEVLKGKVAVLDELVQELQMQQEAPKAEDQPE